MTTTSLHVAYELSPADERFVTLDRYADADWLGFSAQPQNLLERKIQRPKLSRYRSAVETVRSTHSRGRPFIISHMPTLTVAIECARRVLGEKAPHIAFAFNYTELPFGKRLTFQKRLLASVDRFVVFSNYERKLYSEHFEIPVDRFVFTPWTQNPPPVATLDETPFNGNYFCAIGGEGRDYPLLVEATLASKTPLVIVGRPHSMEGKAIPPHVRFMSNLPLATTWAIAKNSRGMILPLKTNTTCCGQITVISAMMLGIPVLCAKSIALSDYIDGQSGHLTYEAGSLDDLTEKLDFMTRMTDELCTRARSRADYHIDRLNRTTWTKTLEIILDELQAQNKLANR